MYKWLVCSRWSVNVKHVVILTARPGVSNTCVSAFHLWFQDHTVPKEQGLKLQRAILTPAAPPLSPSFTANGNHWQFHCLGRLDKEIGRNDVRQASTHSVANMEPWGPRIPFAPPFPGHSQQQPRFLGPQYTLMANMGNFLSQRLFSVGLPQTFTAHCFIHSIADHSFLTNVWLPLPCYFFIFIFRSIISGTSISLPVSSPYFVPFMNPQITTIMVAKYNRTRTSVYPPQKSKKPPFI